MHILITGASGFIGKQLVHKLASQHKLTLLSRHPEVAVQLLGVSHSYLSSLAKLRNLDDFDAVINLAGEPIAAKRWSDSQKHLITTSRWQLTAQIQTLIENSSQPPKVLINASAIGIYGNSSHKHIITEDQNISQQNKQSFPYHVCHIWEQAALKAASDKTRVCLLRVGLVLGLSGGALSKMLPAFKLGLGGSIAGGTQGMSWIHEDDLIAIILYLLTNETCHGVYNATAPTPVNNQTFTQALAKAINRPAFFPVPAIVLKLILGEMAQLLIEGQFVYPKRIIENGYQFQYTEIDNALASLFEPSNE